MSDAPVQFFIPWAATEVHERRLPHWRQGSAALFVTWRLADALPAGLLAAWRHERDSWLARHPTPWTDSIRQTYAERFGQAIDHWLDAGSGSCMLRDPAARSEVVRALRHFDQLRYQLHGWVVMPNHVHVLFSPDVGENAGRIIGAWKGVSARRIQQARETVPVTGNALVRAPVRTPFWQTEYWDTLVRSPGHFAACLRYIASNPTVANLGPCEYSVWLHGEEG